MTVLMDAIKGRRSIRRYQGKDISPELLDKVLEAVKWSPSWANTQCWELIVVRDLSTRKRLQSILSKTNPALKAVVQAPVVIGVCGKLGISGCYKGEAKTRLGDWLMYDLGIATQSLCLAAHDEGLGTVIIGSFDHDKAKEILNVGESYELVSLIPVGFPEKGSPVPKRRENHEFVHHESF